jgi:hypothetical protein
MVQKRIVPTIRDLYADDELSNKLKFSLILSLEQSQMHEFDFHDLPAIEAYLNEFQTK